MSTKAGARHSAADQKAIQAAHDAIVGAGAACDPADMPMKADDLSFDDTPAFSQPMAIKASEVDGAWVLDILGVPFGGPRNGKDEHGEFFSPATKLLEDKYALPPLAHYHGYNLASNQPEGDPVFLGMTLQRTVKADGVWYRGALDKSVPESASVFAAAQRGTAVASSGSISHIKRVDRNGHIRIWPVVELSLWDTAGPGNRKPANAYAVALPALKALYATAHIDLPAESTGDPEVAGDATVTATTPAATTSRSATKGRSHMDEESIKAAIADAIKADREAQAAVATAAAADQERIDTAVKAERVKWEADAAKARRLPYGEHGNEAPAMTQFHGLKKYDGLTAGEQAVFLELMQSTSDRRQYRGAPEDAYKAYAIKLAEDANKGGEIGHRAGDALKFAGFDVQDALKANEVMQSTLSGFGSDWVGVGYGTTLWELIRINTWVLDMIPQKELPRGVATWVDPLESTDPTWYKVGQTASDNATTLTPDATVTDSQFATTNKTLSVAKVGARIEYSGEFDEDSLIDVASEVRRKLGVSGAEMLESLVIDGDTTLTATTNINYIDGTPTTQYYLALNGFRKSAIITTSANSRSAGGAFASTDFLETVKLMGGAGVNALDSTKVGFIIDPLTNYKALTLIDVKTRDINSNATIESGKLSSIYAYNVRVSAQMCKQSTSRLSDTTGKVNFGTQASNVGGSIVAVRWDQWRLGWKRRMQLESLRIARADITEFVATMRVGMVQRDTEASAVTYRVGV